MGSVAQPWTGERLSFNSTNTATNTTTTITTTTITTNTWITVESSVTQTLPTAASQANERWEESVIADIPECPTITEGNGVPLPTPAVDLVRPPPSRRSLPGRSLLY